MTSAKDFLNKLRGQNKEIIPLYLHNTKYRDGTYIYYQLRNNEQRVFYEFKANGFYWAIQYANEWARKNNAVITGTTLADCKDFVNRTIKYPCGVNNNSRYQNDWVK